MGRSLLLAALDVLGASPASRLGPTGKREVALQRLRGSVSALVRNQARKAEEVAKRRASRLGGSDDEDDMGSYMSSYPGPNYDELDESVQEEFHKYLEARGVDSGLANYIMEVHIDKEQKEYTRWLENVGNFVRAK